MPLPLDVDHELLNVELSGAFLHVADLAVKGSQPEDGKIESYNRFFHEVLLDAFELIKKDPSMMSVQAANMAMRKAEKNGTTHDLSALTIKRTIDLFYALVRLAFDNNADLVFIEEDAIDVVIRDLKDQIHSS